ncbi:L,D-transpeptidase family protein [Sphingorhabdus profundilacus]
MLPRENPVESIVGNCYMGRITQVAKSVSIFIRGIFMQFLAIIRNLSASLMLVITAPALAQVAGEGAATQQLPPPPVAPPMQQAETPPPSLTPPPPAPKPVRKKGPVDALKPGQFVWETRESYEGPMKIVVVLDIQRIYVFQNDKLLGFSTISSGKKGKETPTGYFNILQKNIDHKSNLYSNAPMPYMQRLTWDGIAMHGGQLPGYPASHGCIRLPHPFAKALFDATQMNQEVVVLQNISTPVKRPEPKVEPVAEPAVETGVPVNQPGPIAPIAVPGT